MFNDYTLNTLFHYNVSKINLITNEISAKSKNIAFNASATLNDTGDFSIYANVSLDLKNMLFDYNMAHVRIADFNPYMEYYMATPFLGGYMDYKSTDSVINRNLKSTNFIHIAGLEAGKKTSSKPVYDIPVRTAVALLKDGKGNIDLNLPANGNLDDPNYKIGKIIWPTIADLLKKAVSSPFKLLAKALNRDPEAMKQMNIAYMRDKLEEKELHKLEDILAVLKMKKELNVEIVQVIDSVEEKYELALEMAKEQYYNETHKIVNDSLLSKHKKRKAEHNTSAIATQDSLFDKYLNTKLQLTGTELITIEDKCRQLIGDSVLNSKVHDLMEQRNREITEYFDKKKQIQRERIKVITNKDSELLDNFPEPVFYIKYSAENQP